MGYDGSFHRSCQGYIEQAAFFLDRGVVQSRCGATGDLVMIRSYGGEDAFFHCWDNDDRPLKPLGLMHGHQENDIVFEHSGLTLLVYWRGVLDQPFLPHRDLGSRVGKNKCFSVRRQCVEGTDRPTSLCGRFDIFAG